MAKYFGVKALLAASIAVTFSMAAVAGDLSSADPDASVSTKFNVSSLESGDAETTYQRFIVRYRDDAAEQSSRTSALQNLQAAVARASVSDANLRDAKPTLQYQRKLATGAELVTTSRALSRDEAQSLIESIAADPAVEYVAPDVMRRHTSIEPAAFIPNDSFFNAYQNEYKPANGVATPGSNKIANWGGSNITNAWDLADGTGVTIAVLDTGIVKHADVNTSLADAGYDFITDAYVSDRANDERAPGGWDTGDWTNEDKYLIANGGCVNKNQQAASSWHGTHVASAAGAQKTNNNLWGAGIAYNAKVVPIRVLGHCGGYDSDINDAIVWAAGGHVDGLPANKNPAKVINLSLGGPGKCLVTDEAALAIAKANALGAVVVVAAGNDGKDVRNYSPASCPGAITVASNGITSRLAYYSNYNPAGVSVVDLAAFGGGVNINDSTIPLQWNPEGFAWQAVNTGAKRPEPSPAGDTLGGSAGTSQATPHVTGTVALLQSARLALGKPLLKPEEVRAVLKSSAHAPKVAAAAAKTYGAGLLDAAAAVVAANQVVVGLSNGVIVTDQSGHAGVSTVYKLVVPAGALALTLRTMGGTGDVSIYVKAGSAGSASNYDFKSVKSGNTESVAISRPVATTYFITVVNEVASSGVSVVGTFSAPRI